MVITFSFLFEMFLVFKTKAITEFIVTVEKLPLIDINYTKVYENRTESSGIWDIGIVGVETPITFNYMVQPVCLTFHQGDKAYANEYIISLGNPFNVDFLYKISIFRLGRYSDN